MCIRDRFYFKQVMTVKRKLTTLVANQNSIQINQPKPIPQTASNIKAAAPVFFQHKQTSIVCDPEAFNQTLTKRWSRFHLNKPTIICLAFHMTTNLMLNTCHPYRDFKTWCF